ncbi:7-cyano-7-deazaguanine synthase [Virgibacillus sp. NKC19-3]|uniref:7-cyano-7-deazaguanine synthase n=1 Tax=Virgibacillus saliphilus TaxID=2831674 RepID=UPI001C9A5409|nr:7-cyano-7-deazaguanine synthase [Virgibacillus sp. NKC19-3]MBY7144598.1 7-cyano-7-deazaguanine synthase [Virgibacillus sp. NKC19-3]
MLKKVLWTGGWDSTFRVLDLVLNKKVNIQPYYIIDENRPSTYMEFKTMDRIIDMIKEMDESASCRIMERIDIRKKDISDNSNITKSYRRLADRSHLGAQYDWLARYTNSLGINDLELCVHTDDTVEGFIKNDVDLVDNNNDRFYKLKEYLSDQDLGIFSYYHFPLLDMTKLDMQEQASISGFKQIMEETWFCHSPIYDQPCGMCNPCKYTREEGLGRRVPTPTLRMKIKGNWNRLKKRLK